MVRVQVVDVVKGSDTEPNPSWTVTDPTGGDKFKVAFQTGLGDKIRMDYAAVDKAKPSLILCQFGEVEGSATLQFTDAKVLSKAPVGIRVPDEKK